jgi:acyl-coenzyme A thioesterase PaaI-like protein
LKKQLQALLDRSRFLRPYGFRVVLANKGKCTLELPHRAALERPGGIINGPALVAAADCAMWLAIKAQIGIEEDALTSELNTAFLAPAKGEHVYCTATILNLGRRRIYGVAECHGKRGGLYSHHTLTYVRPG